MGHSRLALSASKEDRKWARIANAKTRANAIHRVSKGLWRASSLEVIHVDHQEHVRQRIEIHTWPIVGGLQTALQKCVMTMFLPISPRIGMAIQGKAKGANGSVEGTPSLRACLFWELNPSGDTL